MMLRIVSDVEGASAHRAQRSGQSLRGLWRVWRPTPAVLVVGSLSLLTVAWPAPSQAATIGSLQAQADRLQQQIQSAGEQI